MNTGKPGAMSTEGASVMPSPINAATTVHAGRSDGIRIALTAGSRWEASLTGVNTFFKEAFSEWMRVYDCCLDGNPYRQQELPSLRGRVREEPCPVPKAERRSPSALRLMAGYLIQLYAQVLHVWKRRSMLRGRIIVAHEFGCEVMPIAYRLVMPRSTILAIVHTHPGQDAAAAHPVRRAIERLCYKSVSDLVFNSHSTMELWRRKLGLANIKGRVIWYGIDVAAPSVPSDYPPKAEGCVDFVYLAQFYAWKGQLDFLRIWKDAVARIPVKVRLIMIGDGVSLPACREYVAQNGLSESVIFLGQKPQGSAYLNGGDVLVHLPPEPEAFGLVILEAMRAKLPVVASAIGGICEIIKDGETGFLVDPTSAEQVEHTICEIARKPQLRDTMGEQGRLRWQAEFTREHMLKKYDHVFARLSGRGNVK